MKKAEFVEKIATKTGMTKTDANKVVDAVFDTVKETLIAKDELTINGFGKFKTVSKDARKARNPKTGDTIEIPAKTVPKFTYAAAFKKEVE